VFRPYGAKGFGCKALAMGTSGVKVITLGKRNCQARQGEREHWEGSGDDDNLHRLACPWLSLWCLKEGEHGQCCKGQINIDACGGEVDQRSLHAEFTVSPCSISMHGLLGKLS
jgi:hypothetical protein